MEYSIKDEQLKNVQKQLANLVRDLKIEKLLYANMKEILKKRENEITSLYVIISDLLKINTSEIKLGVIH